MYIHEDFQVFNLYWNTTLKKHAGLVIKLYPDTVKILSPIKRDTRQWTIDDKHCIVASNKIKKKTIYSFDTFG